MRRCLTLVACLTPLWCLHPLKAQAITQPVDVKPKTCATSDSLLGPALDFGKARVAMIASVDRNSTILLSQESPPEPRGTPIKTVIFMLTYGGRSTPAPKLNMQFNVVDTALRDGLESELTLTVDDSLRWRLGRTLVQSHGGGKRDKVPQGLSISLTADESRRFAQATAVSGLLGNTAFAFTPAQLSTARALLTVAVCGQTR